MLAVRSGAAAVTSGQRLGLRSVSLGPAPPACAQRRLVLGDMTSPLTHRVCRPARPAAGLAAAIVLVLGSAISAAATPQRAAAATSLVPANHAASAWQCRHASSRGSGGLQEWPARIRARVAVQFALDDIGGYRPGGGASDHHTGLALDVMVRGEAGDEVADWFRAHAQELNVKYVIWQQGIWFPGREGYRPMQDRGSDTENHYDHVHISFHPGAGTCPR